MCFDPVREMTAKASVRYHIAAGSAINARATSGKYLSRRPVVFQVFRAGNAWLCEQKSLDLQGWLSTLFAGQDQTTAQ
jgi:hypothetical protein